MDIIQSAAHIGMPTATVVVTGAILLLFSTLLYRLKFHPLAKYPGPFLARCTSWYAAYHSYTGNIHLDIARCHEKYGDVVRYRPNGLIFNNVEGLHDVYSRPSVAKKATGYLNFHASGAVSLISAIDKDDHAPRRRLLSRAFSTAALQDYASIIYDKATVFCNILNPPTDALGQGTTWGPPRDIGHLSSYFTFDVMSTVVFYTPQNLMTDKKGRGIVEEIDSLMVLAGVSTEQPLFGFFPILRRLLLPKSFKDSQKFDKKSRQFAVDRVALGNDREIHDVFGNLLKKEGSKLETTLSVPELAADGAVMMVAGTDTSSAAISATLFFLSRNPSAYAKLLSEVRSTFATAEEIRPGHQLSSCSYLRACIDEALRLAPPVPTPLWRETKNDGDVFGGIALPKGTDVATCLYTIHRNPAYFPDPDDFRPERWLSSAQDNTAIELAKRAFAPYSLGSRGCIGKNLAYQEMTTLVAQICYQMEFKIAEGDLGKVGETRIPGTGRLSYRIWGHFTSRKEGPFLQFTRRSP